MFDIDVEILAQRYVMAFHARAEDGRVRDANGFLEKVDQQFCKLLIGHRVANENIAHFNDVLPAACDDSDGPAELAINVIIGQQFGTGDKMVTEIPSRKQLHHQCHHLCQVFTPCVQQWLSRGCYSAALHKSVIRARR